jgi:hypothetical protein
MADPLPPGFYRCGLVVDGELTEADVIPAPGQSEADVQDYLAAVLYPGRAVTVDRFTIGRRPVT